MNRRHFLKGAGTALLGVATAGLAVASTENKSDFPTITSRAQELWEKQKKLYEESINNYKRIEGNARRATMRELDRFKDVIANSPKTS